MSVRNAFITLVAAGTAAAQIGGIDKNLNGEQGEFIAGTRGQVAKHVTEEVVDELDEAPQTSVSHDTFLTEQVTVQFPFSPGFAPDEPSDVSDLDLSGNTAYNIKAALESSAKQITRDEKVPKDLSIRKAIKLIRANGGLKADVDVHIQGRSGPLALLNEEADALRKQTRYDTNRILARERLREVDDFIVGNVKAGVEEVEHLVGGATDSEEIVNCNRSAIVKTDSDGMKKLLNAIDLSKKTIDYDEYKYLDGPHDVWEAFMKDRNYMVDDDEDEVMDDDRVAVPEPDTKTLEAILLLNKQYQESDNQSLYKETLNDARGVSVIVTVDTHTELPLMYVDVDEAATPAEQGEGPSDEHLQNHDPKNDIDGDQTHRKTPNKNIPRYEARKHTRKKSGKSRQPDARGFFS